MIYLNRLRWWIGGVGFLQAGILLADVLVALNTGQYLTASLPRVSGIFLPTQWSLLFTIRGVQVLSDTVQTVFFISSGVWLVGTLLFLWNPDRLWWPLVAVAVLGIWYAPLGLWLSVVVIVLLSAFRILKNQFA